MENTLNDPIGYAENIVAKDPFALYLGIELEEIKQGYARCSLTVKPEHLNAAERSHESVIFSIASQAFSIASNSTGAMALGINFNIHYISYARDGEKIFSEATEINVGKKISTWEVRVWGSEDRLIATSQGIAYHR